MNKRFPAEWENHRATLIAWPHNTEDWPGKFIPIHWVYSEIVKNIGRHEKVLIVVDTQKQKDFVKNILAKSKIESSFVDFIIQKTDRSWMRDSSPAFVRKDDNNIEAVQFSFNGWAKYDNWKKDKDLPEAVAKKLNIPMQKCMYKEKMLVLEGGAIDINGEGTMLSTEECLLHPSVQIRNPGFTKEAYAKVFEEFLGITNIIWLGEGIAGDDTHGHVDDLCRFVNRDTVVLCREKNRGDENYKRLNENFERLQNARIQDGSKLNVVELPMPSPIVFDGMRLPASYANFIFTNGSVLVPTFNDKNDRLALNIIAELLPEREVIGINATDLIWGLGTLHCLSHEIPE